MTRRSFLVALAAAPPKRVDPGAKIPVRIAAWMEPPDVELQPSGFLVKIDGAEARVINCLGPDADLLLIVILDFTGDLTLVDAARKAFADALELLPPKAHVGLMRAQDGLQVLVDPTPDRGRLREAITNLPVSGKAALLETVETGLRVGDAILTKTAPRVALLYLTDSDVHNYREDFTNPVINSSDSRDLSRRFPEQLVREKIFKLQNSAQAAETPLFIAHLDYRSDRLNEAYQSGLMELATTTGGLAVFCRSVPEIPEAVKKLIRTIASHWSLKVEVPGAAKMIQVEASNSGRLLRSRPRLALHAK